MAFNKIVPPAKPEKVKGGIAMVRIAVGTSRGGKIKGTVSLADSQLTSLGWDKEEITHVVVYEGIDDDYGKLRFEAAKEGDEGAVKLAKQKYGGARFHPHSFAALPSKKIGQLACSVISVDETGIVIALPMLEWSKAGVVANQIERRTQVREDAQRRHEETEGVLINVLGQPIVGDVWCKPIEYLAKKGIQCAKLGGDFWQYRPEGGESERVSTDELLTRINKLRHKYQLKAIGKHQLVQERI